MCWNLWLLMGALSYLYSIKASPVGYGYPILEVLRAIVIATGGPTYILHSITKIFPVVVFVGPFSQENLPSTHVKKIFVVEIAYWVICLVFCYTVFAWYTS